VVWHEGPPGYSVNAQGATLRWDLSQSIEPLRVRRADFEVPEPRAATMLTVTSGALGLRRFPQGQQSNPSNH